MDDERDALAASYLDDFQVLVHPRTGRPQWRIALGEYGVALLVDLPEGYPTSQAPSMSLEFDAWPAGGDAFAERMSGEVLELWEPGEGCVIQWADYVRQELSDGPAELATTGGPRPGDERSRGDAGGGAGGDNGGDRLGPGMAMVPLSADLGGQVGTSLVAAGFVAYGHGIFSHGDRGATVEVGVSELSLTVDGIDAEDLSDRASIQLQVDVANFGKSFVEWVTAQRSPEPGFTEDGGEVAAGEGLEFLPPGEELGVTGDRELLVLTWGKALRKAAPPESECNFNAGILNGRGGGADLRTMNGLSDEVQSNVACCSLFPRWISMVCAKVEHSDLRCISINCTKGRHRSVAAAEILRKLYYPRATVRHLTIS